MSNDGDADWTKVCRDTLTDGTSSEGSFNDLLEPTVCPVPSVSEQPRDSTTASEQGVATDVAREIAPFSPCAEAFRLLETACKFQQCKSFSFTFDMVGDGPPAPARAQLSAIATEPHLDRGKGRDGCNLAVAKEVWNAGLIIVVTLLCAVAFTYGVSRVMVQAAAGGLEAGTLSDELDRVTQQLQARNEAFDRLQLQLQEANARLATVREANTLLHSDINHLSNENRELLMRESGCTSARESLQRWANQLESDKYQLRKAIARCWC